MPFVPPPSPGRARYFESAVCRFGLAIAKYRVWCLIGRITRHLGGTERNPRRRLFARFADPTVN